MAELESYGKWEFKERGDKYCSHPNTNLDTLLEIWREHVSFAKKNFATNN